MRRLVAALCSTVLQLNIASAIAQTGPISVASTSTEGTCGVGNDGQLIRCLRDDESQFVTFTGVGSQGSPGTTVRYYAYDRLVTGPDGQACVTTGYAVEGTTPADRFNNDLVDQT